MAQYRLDEYTIVRLDEWVMEKTNKHVRTQVGPPSWDEISVNDALDLLLREVGI